MKIEKWFVLIHTGDEDVGVATAVVGAAHLIGAHCRVGSWLPLALEAVAAPKIEDASRANASVILSALLYGAGGISFQNQQDTKMLHGI